MNILGDISGNDCCCCFALQACFHDDNDNHHHHQKIRNCRNDLLTAHQAATALHDLFLDPLLFSPRKVSIGNGNKCSVHRVFPFNEWSLFYYFGSKYCDRLSPAYVLRQNSRTSWQKRRKSRLRFTRCAQQNRAVFSFSIFTVTRETCKGLIIKRDNEIMNRCKAEGFTEGLPRNRRQEPNARI